MTTLDWTAKIDQELPGLLDDYRGDPVAMRRIAALVDLLPEGESSTIILRVLNDSRMRLDDSQTRVFVGALLINFTLVRHHERTFAGETQSLVDRIRELRQMVSNLTENAAVSHAEADALRERVMLELKELTSAILFETKELETLHTKLKATAKSFADDIIAQTGQDFRKIKALAGDVHDTVVTLEADTAKAIDAHRKTVEALTTRLEQQPETLVAAAAEKVTERLGQRLDAFVDSIVELAGSKTAETIETTAYALMKQVVERLEKVDASTGEWADTLSKLFGGLRVKTVKLHPALEVYLGLSTLPRNVVITGAIATAGLAILMGLTGFIYGSHLH